MSSHGSIEQEFYEAIVPATGTCPIGGLTGQDSLKNHENHGQCKREVRLMYLSPCG